MSKYSNLALNGDKKQRNDLMTAGFKAIKQDLTKLKPSKDNNMNPQNSQKNQFKKK